MSEKQAEDKTKSRRTFNVGVSAHLDIIVPVEIEADPNKLEAAIIGDFEGVPVVDGEAYEEAGDAAEKALMDDDELTELLGELVSKAYVIKIRYPQHKDIQYIINKPMSVIR